MNIDTILLFFIYTWGLGYSISKIHRPIENFFERHVMNIALGLAAIPLLGVIFNVLRIPIDWKTYPAVDPQSRRPF